MVIIICVEDGFVLLITLFPQGGRKRKAYIEEMEMRSLLATLGLKVGFHKMFTHKEDNPNYLIGPGQAEEAAMVAKETGVGEVVVDAFLTPRQEKNLEQLFQLPVVDRENVILSIFFQNAHSTEARLQIMKAQAEYLKPRLQAREENLSQQRGGVRGAKGEGERKIELERRLINDRIAGLKKDLERLRRTRTVQSKERKGNGIFTFALVGYTNAGKSSIMKALTGSDVLVEDKLFATLDTTTRALRLPDGRKVLLSDTVGFISNLPHRLIEAFGSTLEEALDADAVMIVADLSHPDAYSCYETTVSTLEELGARDRIKLLVLNKSDCIYDDFSYMKLKSTGFPTVETSVKEKKGLDGLLRAMEEISRDGMEELVVECGGDGSLLSELGSRAEIVSYTWKDDHAELVIRYRKEYRQYMDKVIKKSGFRRGNPDGSS